MFDFDSKKIHHNIALRATTEKKFRGKGEGYRYELSLVRTADAPPPVGKILATRLHRSLNIYKCKACKYNNVTNCNLVNH